MSVALQELETRMAGLRDLIKRRQHSAPKHAEAARCELHEISISYIRLKIDRGDWQPSAIIERMNG